MFIAYILKFIFIQFIVVYIILYPDTVYCIHVSIYFSGFIRRGAARAGGTFNIFNNTTTTHYTINSSKWLTS